MVSQLLEKGQRGALVLLLKIGTPHPKQRGRRGGVSGRQVKDGLPMGAGFGESAVGMVNGGAAQMFVSGKRGKLPVGAVCLVLATDGG